MEPTIDLYRQLPAAKAAPLKLKLTAADPFTPQYVKGRMLLLDNAAKESRERRERNAKKAKVREAKERKKLGVLGRRQGTARELGLWGFDESQAKFTLFLPLHHLWMGYMSELLNLPPSGSGHAPRPLQGAAIHPKLLKADFHGSIMTVHQSKNTAILGISGIVIHETEGTFKVVTKENKLKVLPKRNSIFTFAVPVYSTLPPTHNTDAPLPIPEAAESLKTVLDGAHMRLELHGNQFCFRSADRAGEESKTSGTAKSTAPAPFLITLGGLRYEARQLDWTVTWERTHVLACYTRAGFWLYAQAQGAWFD
ncbi:Ribonuclease P protein subunit [Mycena venus]|uniref:Ribonuclease P protein subunit n=1 Tax=Mycena venus TaxID=2733690 RepID=A0A8H6Z3A8_9AGAR|nr:Ribonuclease P protein subunit [Mycena venus]